jgi:hypothetical protein
MAKLETRYSKQEWDRLAELIYPEERRQEFGDGPWNGEGFRHFRDPKVACIEHYLPKAKPIRPGAFSRKPAA